MTRRRLDTELVRRGLVPSRSEAQAAVRDGLVVVGGRPAQKPSTMVTSAEPLELRGTARPFVSRGGEKLDAALDRFGVDPAGVECLDAGASTGGFTDCLLRHGATRVVAVDVGYGQLAWSLRSDPRVVVLERTNVRSLAPGDLPFTPGLIVADLSFISLRLVVPALSAVSGPSAHFVLLVKPQFEAGRADVGRGGVVRDPTVWRRAIQQIVEACRASRIEPRDVMASPIPGPAGNVEFALCGVRGAERVDMAFAIAAAIDEGRRIGGAT